MAELTLTFPCRFGFSYQYNRVFSCLRYSLPDALAVPTTSLFYQSLILNIITIYSIIEADFYIFDDIGFLMDLISTEIIMISADIHSRIGLDHVETGNWLNTSRSHSCG